MEAAAAVFLREARAKAGEWAQGAGGLRLPGLAASSAACLPAVPCFTACFSPVSVYSTVALAFAMAALLAYLASLKLRVLRRRRHAATAAGAAAAPAPQGGVPCAPAQQKRPKGAFNITATAVAAMQQSHSGSGGGRLGEGHANRQRQHWLDPHLAPT